MHSESLYLGYKGITLILGAGVLSVSNFFGDVVSEPNDLIKVVEGLGPQGLLVAGIVYLYRANLKLEAEMRRIRDQQSEAITEQARANRDQYDLLKQQIDEANHSRDLLYKDIRGALNAHHMEVPRTVAELPIDPT